MRALSQDLSIYNRFNFEYSPVGVKFQFKRPEGIEKTDKMLAACEMLKEAQKAEAPFYFTKENEACFGAVAFGMKDAPPIVEAGHVGPDKLDIFQEPRANSRLYQELPKMPKGTVNYVVMSPLNKLNFEPDLLMLMASPSQAEIVLRATTHSTGGIIETRSTSVLKCAWMYVYPYQSGKVNYTVTGLSMGMKARRVFPEGWILMSIPYNWIPEITRNLHEMKWVLPSYEDTYEEFLQRHMRMVQELEEESVNL